HDDEGRGENQERHGRKRLRRHAFPKQREACRPRRHRLIAAGERTRERKSDAQSEQGIQRIGRHNKLPLLEKPRPAFAKLGDGRHSILKERLTTPPPGPRLRMAARPETLRNHEEITLPMAYSRT